jgi:hypothetical protein
LASLALLLGVVIFSVRYRITWGNDEDALDAELVAKLRKELDEKKRAFCVDCGGLHGLACPRVRRRTFHSNGGVQEVEYWADDAWSRKGVIFPEELYAAQPVKEEQK